MELFKNKIVYMVGSIELIDLVRPLWEQLNKHHEEKSEHFKEKFSNNSFEDRMEKLTKGIRRENIRVEIAKYKGRPVGYCISSITENRIGEIASIYTESNFRGYKIGDNFMKNAIEWLDENIVDMKRIWVAEGNEEVLDFYRKYGFFTAGIVLKQK